MPKLHCTNRSMSIHTGIINCSQIILVIKAYCKLHHKKFSRSTKLPYSMSVEIPKDRVDFFRNYKITEDYKFYPQNAGHAIDMMQTMLNFIKNETQVRNYNE